MILAGVLLKIGGYGFIRVALPVFPEGSLYFSPLIETVSLISIIYASLVTIRQMDFKRLIAYSSVAHMNLAILGIFSFNVQGVVGSLFLMIAHGLASAGLFFCLGFLYNRSKTRLLFYFGGLRYTMPLFSNFLFLFCLGNIGLPLTCNFVGELLIFIGLIDENPFVTVVALTSVVFSVIYTMFFFNRLAFGTTPTDAIIYRDVSKRETAILVPLVLSMFILGCFPSIMTNYILPSVYSCLEFKPYANLK